MSTRPPADDADESPSDEDITDWPSTGPGGADSGPPWIPLGAVGLVVVGVYAFPMLPLDVYIMSNLTNTRPLAFVREWFYPTVAAGVMSASLWRLRGLMDATPLVKLVILIPAGIAVYGLTALVLARFSSWGIRNDIRSIAGSLS